MYKVGKTQKIQPLFLYSLLDQAFDTASLGYQLYKDADLMMDVVNFAKASEKFGKNFGKCFCNSRKAQLLEGNLPKL